METVEVMIRIPKRTYDRVSERGIIAYGDDAYYIGHAIENGTVLPKGHGRLVDISLLYQNTMHYSNRTRDLIMKTVGDSVVVEADKDGDTDG